MSYRMPVFTGNKTEGITVLGVKCCDVVSVKDSTQREMDETQTSGAEQRTQKWNSTKMSD